MTWGYFAVLLLVCACRNLPLFDNEENISYQTLWGQKFVYLQYLGISKQIYLIAMTVDDYLI